MINIIKHLNVKKNDDESTRRAYVRELTCAYVRDL